LEEEEEEESVELQEVAITIPHSIRVQNQAYFAGSGSDECYGTGSDENQLDPFDDGQTDFMNATANMYENLCQQESNNRPPLPPERMVVEEDECALYGM
jgi:hypothetical protein